ncbi:MAG: thiamine phosphate synthase [Deltaproteobacteria bacterium]|nr:thiamine phosphate synthase [Deltaproteobacteria bacterium]
MSSKISGFYAIADNSFRPDLTPVDLARAYVEGGCRLIQLRVKDDVRCPMSDVRKFAEAIMVLKKKYDFTFIMNDHVDIALEVGADGVHVGADDMPVDQVRRQVGAKMLIGYSSHSISEALEAQKAGADYVAFGAIFPTKTKGPGHPVQGLDRLRELVTAVPIPVVAIGGITRGNFKNVMETGASAIAMITALTDSPNIEQEARFFVEHL